jgi:glyoxylase-like metal-dependent hydrolase (beta-lactamase superfamily II)
MARAPVVQLAHGVWRIPLIGDFTNGFAFRDDDGQVTLLDMGLARSGPKVMAALAAIGSGPADVTRLLLTHCHPDHVGGTAYVAERTGLPVDVHAGDAAYVRSGTQPPADPTLRLGRLLQRLPQPKLPGVPVGEELHDGQLLDVAGGLRVIHTPGHSPGHASYLHEPSGVLVTGDALFNVGRLWWPIKALCSDFVMTKQTAHRLAEAEYTLAAFTHGPEIREAPRERIRRFLARRG